MKFTLKGFTEFCKSRDPAAFYSYMNLGSCPVSQYCRHIGITYRMKGGMPSSSDSAQLKAEWAASQTNNWGELVEKLESKCWLQKKEVKNAA